MTIRHVELDYWEVHDLRYIVQKCLERSSTLLLQEDGMLLLWSAIPEDHQPPGRAEEVRSGLPPPPPPSGADLFSLLRLLPPPWRADLPRVVPRRRPPPSPLQVYRFDGALGE